MSQNIEARPKAGMNAEIESYRMQGFDSCANYIASIGNRLGISFSESTVKEYLSEALGLPKGTIISQYRALLGDNHPLSSHFRITENGQQFYFDKYLLLLTLQKLAEARAMHRQVTVRMSTKKLLPYLSDLRNQLGLSPQE
jgi:hypothetical protein